jgi:hypothetical protein
MEGKAVEQMCTRPTAMVSVSLQANCSYLYSHVQ